MIKVLIVEDERRTARAIGQLVEQHADYTVVGMESNGADALVFLGSHEVDLVITDIRMPVMDGMELLKILQGRFPHCLTVVLSGYSEFEYAKTAIRYHAFDYLLKPINKADLFRLLDRIAEEASRRNSSRLRNRLQAALDGEAVEQGSEWYYLLLAQQNGWNQSHLVRQIFGEACQIFSGSPDSQRLLIVSEAEGVLERAESFYRLASEQAASPLRLICAGQPLTLRELHTAAGQLRRLLKRQAHMFRSEFLVVNPREAQLPPEARPLRELKPERAVDAICAQNRGELEQCLAQVLLPGTRRTDVQNYLDTVIHDSRISYSTSPGRLSQMKSTLSDLLDRVEDPDSCLREVTDHLLSLLKEPTTKRNVAEIVEEIAQHMEANYHTAISVEALAKQYNFVPRYLNKVFRDHKGVRPMEYLLTLRIHRAKAMLEANPEALVKDVASSVGYSDPLYFSRIFKRETGLWPTEYQAK